MGYGLSWYGLGWYGQSGRVGTNPISAGGRVAAHRTDEIDVCGAISGGQRESIDARGAISFVRWHELYAGGHVLGRTGHSIPCLGYVGAWSISYIRSIANVSVSRYNYIQSTGRIAYTPQYHIMASGFVLGYTTSHINTKAVISEPHQSSVQSRARISNAAYHQIWSVGKIASHPAPETINAKSTISTLCNKILNSRGVVSTRKEQSTSARARISSEKSYETPAMGCISIKNSHVVYIDNTWVAQTGRRYNINAHGRVTIPQHHQIYAYGNIIRSPYYYLNGKDITWAVLEGVKASGPEPKFEKILFPGRITAKLVDQGHAPLEYSFDVFFRTIEDAFEYVQAMKNPTDMRFYPGDSLWFHKVRYISTERVKRRLMSLFVIKTTVYLEKPYLYRDLYSEWSLTNTVLPRVSQQMQNSGHIDMPLELLQVTGHYSSTHLRRVTVGVRDGGEELESMVLTDRMLSDEVVELDEDGILTCTYYDDFSSCMRFTQDTTRSNATCSGGRVTISPNGYVIYELKGVWPLMRNIEMRATLEASGSPVVEVSIDGGTTYIEAVSTSYIQNGRKATYYLPDTSGYRNVLVRFRCGSGSTLYIDDLEFKAIRRVGDPLPKIPAGASRSIQISDAANSSHRASILARFRVAKYPV